MSIDTVLAHPLPRAQPPHRHARNPPPWTTVRPTWRGARPGWCSWFGYPPLQTTLDGLHRHLMLGEPGRVYSEMAASWLPVLVIGGLAL